jgi:hypothetical protein
VFQDIDFNNLWLIVSKPDNVPVLGLYVLLAFFTGWGLWQGVINDRRKAAGKPIIEDSGEKVHCWPYLTRIEFISLILVMVLLTVWSITLDAPLEEPANPSQTPNPSKAPWYFLGLQEMLVYFDPWFAGVVLPMMIINGLIVIPYVDTNTKSSGYYTVRERPFALFVFFFGFFVLWCAQIFIGTFMRGPGWNFFGIFETWDAHKIVVANNVDLTNVIAARVISPIMSLLGVADTVRLSAVAAFDSQATIGVVIGAALVLGYMGLGPISYLFGRRIRRREEVLDPDTGRVREGAKLATIDAVVGTNPSSPNPMRLMLDLFAISFRLPTAAALAFLRVPSVNGALFGVALVGLVAWFTFGFVTVGVSTGAVLNLAFGLLALLWLRREENWRTMRGVLLEGVPNWLTIKVNDLGLLRYAIVSGLFLMMFGVPAKMVLRWTLAVKYIWVLPGVFNV